MRRISTATRVPNKFGAGKDGYTDGDVVGGVAATDLEALQFDNFQEELAAIVEATGVALDGAKLSQVVTALRSNALIVATDTGAANAAVLTYAPAIAALTDNMVLWFKAAATNTGATTINVSGLGVKPLVGSANAALQGGEIVANGKCMVVYDAALSKFVLIECTGGALQVPNAAQSQQAVAMGQLFGGLKGFARFIANGSIVVPAGVTTMYLSATGPGGGGGAGGGGGVSNFVGGGGGGGASGVNRIRIAVTVVPGQTITVTIGTGGTGGTATVGAGGAGTTGGSTVITNVNGATLTLLGGDRGLGGNNAVTQTSGGQGGIPTDVSQASGGYGQDVTNGNAGGSGGAGGSGPFGGGGPSGPGRTSGGFAAQLAGGYGAGGGGGGGLYSGSGGSAPGGNGNAGTGGFVFLEW